jgi:4a-hydroxytetrahydrobiopterin dehydratase
MADREKPSVLGDPEVEAALAEGDGPRWHLVGGKLVKTVDCAGFVGSLAFVGEVGRLAEEANHHPDIDIRYNRVTLALVTHDAGGITRFDLALARAIDGVTAGVRTSPGAA